jgi:hypothetical protein
LCEFGRAIVGQADIIASHTISFSGDAIEEEVGLGLILHANFGVLPLSFAFGGVTVSGAPKK